MNIAAISHRVLLAAAATTPGSDSASTSDLLYHGNWLPLSPEWLARFPDFELADPDAVTWATGQVRGPRTLPHRIPTA